MVRTVLRIQLRDPVLFDPIGIRIRDGKKSGFGMNTPDHISERLAKICWGKNT
jgi:hypothetical protein